MMCLVLRFKACTVCKTVGAVDLDFILSSNREMPTKSKACWVCNSPSLSLVSLDVFPRSLSLYLPQPQ